MNKTPLKKVIRLDSMRLNKAHFTSEGYLKDVPVLTSTGIFEYHNPDGSIRKELRIAEEVFDSDSLASYKGKPIIITHDAGLIDKRNVSENQIGTILSEGFQDGENVKAEIIIHDTGEMKNCGLKELSLGYNLDLDETSGVWNGEEYDAIQRNIRVNHLALVREARAGEQARLNIDGRDKNILKGGKSMVKAVKRATRKDSILSPEELEKAINEYKAKRAASAKTDEGEEGAKKVEPAVTEPVVAEPAVKEPVTPVTKIDEDTVQKPEEETPENMVEFVKSRRDIRDENGDPEDKEEAMGVIAHQDEDIDTLLDIIDSLLAERDFKKDEEQACEEGQEVVGNAPAETEEGKLDGEAEGNVSVITEEENKSEEIDKNIDGEGCEEEVKLNADSVDYIVRERVRVGLAGSKLNIDGLENCKLRTAKKKIINAVRPSINLDGKSASYIDAMFDAAVDEINSRSKNSVAMQKNQMFSRHVNHDSKNDDSALSARARMIARQFKKEK